MSHHHCDHAHHHAGPGHSHAPASFGRAFAIGITLNTLFVITEFIVGQIAHSISLIADAGHNAGDVLALIVAWAATAAGRARPTDQRSYGYKSTSILAALFNALLLLVAVLAIGWEAAHRLMHPTPVAAPAMMVTAAIGILINGLTAWLFMRGRDNDINIRSAYLHMATDALVSFGVVIGGALVWCSGYNWIDPLLSLIIAGIIVWSSWKLLRDALHLALQGTPPHISVSAVRDYLLNLSGVSGLHDLHIWAMSTTDIAMTAHLTVPDAVHNDAILARAAPELLTQFGIHHATLQIERDITCALAPDEVV